MFRVLITGINVIGKELTEKRFDSTEQAMEWVSDHWDGYPLAVLPTYPEKLPYGVIYIAEAA